MIESSKRISQVCIGLRQDQLALLDEESHSSRRPKSEIIREAIDFFFDSKEKKELSRDHRL